MVSHGGSGVAFFLKHRRDSEELVCRRTPAARARFISTSAGDVEGGTRHAKSHGCCSYFQTDACEAMWCARQARFLAIGCMLGDGHGLSDP